MATKDSIMKQSIFFWVFGHRLSFEYGFNNFLFGAWRNLSGALRELILRRNPSPSVKWKTIALMIWQDVEVSWIAGITFSKRGNGVKIWQKLHF